MIFFIKNMLLYISTLLNNNNKLLHIYAYKNIIVRNDDAVALIKDYFLKMFQSSECAIIIRERKKIIS